MSSIQVESSLSPQINEDILTESSPAKNLQTMIIQTSPPPNSLPNFSGYRKNFSMMEIIILGTAVAVALLITCLLLSAAKRR